MFLEQNIPPILMVECPKNASSFVLYVMTKLELLETESFHFSVAHDLSNVMFASKNIV